jgi:Gas vesicle synthesis protein GvpO
VIDVADKDDRRGSEHRSGSAQRQSTGDTDVALSAKEVAKSALQQISALTGKRPQSVTAIDPTEDGWLVEVEVVEIERIPSTSDLLALYEVELDPDGELVGYRRTRRYSRASSIDGAK